jgi:hypothetical protein
MASCINNKSLKNKKRWDSVMEFPSAVCFVSLLCIKEVKDINQVPEVIFVPIFTNLFLITLPNVGIAVTKAKAIAEAMSAYSIAVAPDWSCINFSNVFIPIS